MTHRHLLNDDIHVNRLGLAKDASSLNARVEDDAVKVGMRLLDTNSGGLEAAQSSMNKGVEKNFSRLRKSRQCIQLGQINRHGSGLVRSMFLHEVIEIFLSAARDDDEDATLDESLREGKTDSLFTRGLVLFIGCRHRGVRRTRRRSQDQNFLVWKRHVDWDGC